MVRPKLRSHQDRSRACVRRTRPGACAMLSMLLARALLIPVGSRLGSLTEGLDPTTIPDFTIEANYCQSRERGSKGLRERGREGEGARMHCDFFLDIA